MGRRVAIIGNGVSGVTLALELRKRDPSAKITIVSGESELHYSRPALMYIFMGHMRYQDTLPYPKSFWNKQDIALRKAWVREINTDQKRLELDSGPPLEYDTLVIATGSVSNKFGWPGQDLDGVQGLYSLQDLEILEENSKGAKHAVIVGGGLIGIEMAEMLHTRGLSVTFLVRESSYWNNIIPEEESQMVNKVIRAEGLKLKLSTNLKEISDNGNGRCSGVVTEFDEQIECEIVGLTPGVSPNKFLAKESGIETARGVVVDPYFQTSALDVFAIGDCAELRALDGSSHVDQLWYTGKMQGVQLAQNLCGEKTEYSKPIFYNSAKFFDLEYQTYGTVRHPVEGEDHLYWESSDNRRSLRIVSKDSIVIGINVMGIRYRHRVCEDWIKRELSLEQVLDSLGEANFDPEFYKHYESEIRSTFLEEAR